MSSLLGLVFVVTNDDRQAHVAFYCAADDDQPGHDGTLLSTAAVFGCVADFLPHDASVSSFSAYLGQQWPGHCTQSLTLCGGRSFTRSTARRSWGFRSKSVFTLDVSWFLLFLLLLFTRIRHQIDHMPHRADSMFVDGPSRQTSLAQASDHQQQQQPSPQQQQDFRFCHVVFVLRSECSQDILQRYIHLSRLISEAVAHEEAHRGKTVLSPGNES